MGSIFKMFGPSPIKPLEQHMFKVHQCVELLYPFFAAVLDQNWLLAQDINEHIAALEKEADYIKRDLRLHLPHGLFLPVSRTNLLELLTAQDRIANRAEDIAGLMVSRQMQIPAQLAPMLSDFLTCCLGAPKQALQVINELDELLESGFRGSEVKIVDDMVNTLDKIEQASDKELFTIRQHIFNLEKDYPAIEIMFLYKLVQWIGDLADHAQTVGSRLQILIAR